MDYKKGLFSVVIATYNNAKLLLDLSFQLLEEGGSVGEIIIIDDGSKDKTPKYIEYLKRIHTGIIKIKTLRNNENTGVIAPRNQGLKLAACEYTMILDDDQIPGCCTFRRYKEAMEKFDIVGYIAGMVNPDVGAIVVDRGEPFNIVGEGGMCIRTALWKNLNYFDEVFSPCYFENVDLELRAIKDFDAKIGCILDSEITHLDHKTLEKPQKVLGFNIHEAGSKNLRFVMKRIRKGYYGESYKVMGKYFNN